MSRWDSLNLDAPHTQRELDEIPQVGTAPPVADFLMQKIEEMMRERLAMIAEIASLRCQLADRDYRC